MNNKDLKAEGQAKALDAAQEWSATASEWVGSLAPGTLFTSEDMTAAVGLPSGGIGTNKNNAVGAKISGFAKQKLVKPVGYVTSRSPHLHAAVLRQWVKV